MSLQVPLGSIAAFGFYSVFTIANNLNSFRDVPSARDSLEEDMKRAHQLLQKRGFKGTSKAR